MTGLEVLNRELRLSEEWQWGGGQRVVWAPSAPTMLDLPGFRDPGAYLDREIDPVFAITLLDRDAHPIPARANERNWTPARLELKYRLEQALITERRAVLSTDTFVSQWTITHAASTVKYFWIVLWTRRPDGRDGRLLSDLEANPQGISFQESVLGKTGREIARWSCALGASFDADSWSVNRAQSSGQALDWKSTPFCDLMAPGGLPGHFPGNDSSPGYSFVALAYPFEIPPGERLVVTFAAAFAPEPEQARSNLERSVSLINPIQASEEEWINWFEDVPSFTCSDPALQRLYWYRWAQQRLLGAASAAGKPLPDESFAGGRSSIDRLDAGRLIDAAWQHSSDQVLADARRLLRHDDTDLGGHALAHAIRRVFSLHPDVDFKREVQDRGARLAQADSLEPAAGVGPRMAVLREPWRSDAHELYPSLEQSVFAYDLLRLLESLSSEEKQSADKWRKQAGFLADVIQREFWDEESGFYLDVHAERGSRRRLKTAFGFYPLLAGIVSPEARARLVEHLCDPEQFWTTHPVPTLSRDDPDFSPDGHWQNLRVDRPFHGRVWPEVLSHVIDGFGREVERAGASDRVLLTELIDRTLRLPFGERGLDKPVFFEHYHPLSGRPAAYLGRSLSSGGWLIDHLLRYVAGIRPDEKGNLVIDPLPMRLEWFDVSRVFIGDHEVDVHWNHRTGLSVHIDEEPAGQAPVGRALSISFPDHWSSDVEA